MVKSSQCICSFQNLICDLNHFPSQQIQIFVGPILIILKYSLYFALRSATKSWPSFNISINLCVGKRRRRTVIFRTCRKLAIFEALPNRSSHWFCACSKCRQSIDWNDGWIEFVYQEFFLRIDMLDLTVFLLLCNADLIAVVGVLLCYDFFSSGSKRRC